MFTLFADSAHSKTFQIRRSNCELPILKLKDLAFDPPHAGDYTLLDDTFEYNEDVTTNTVVLQSLARHHLLSVFTCQASNNNITVPISTSITLDLNCKRRLFRLFAFSTDSVEFPQVLTSALTFELIKLIKFFLSSLPHPVQSANFSLVLFETAELVESLQTFPNPPKSPNSSNFLYESKTERSSHYATQPDPRGKPGGPVSVQHDRRPSAGSRLLSVQRPAQGCEAELQAGLPVSGCADDADH